MPRRVARQHVVYIVFMFRLMIPLAFGVTILDEPTRLACLENDALILAGFGTAVSGRRAFAMIEIICPHK